MLDLAEAADVGFFSVVASAIFLALLLLQAALTMLAMLH